MYKLIVYVPRQALIHLDPISGAHISITPNIRYQLKFDMKTQPKVFHSNFQSKLLLVNNN